MHFNISCLLFIRNQQNKILLLKRRKSPNKGKWSPPGGKLIMSDGESPVECAIREAKEETGMTLSETDLQLFGYVSEKCYENSGHWLMFLFDSKKNIDQLPKEFDEGYFEFFEENAIKDLNIPESDHTLVWPYYFKRNDNFWGLRAKWVKGEPQIKIEAKA
ncbi:MAG: NUDIX domain-containing protein [Opitutales bacterium]|nr:NUDIX domain-containing protein [Opitutales bacterium]